MDSIKGMMGDTGANAVQSMLADASQGVLATVLGSALSSFRRSASWFN